MKIAESLSFLWPFSQTSQLMEKRTIIREKVKTKRERKKGKK